MKGKGLRRGQDEGGGAKAPSGGWDPLQDRLLESSAHSHHRDSSAILGGETLAAALGRRGSVGGGLWEAEGGESRAVCAGRAPWALLLQLLS